MVLEILESLKIRFLFDVTWYRFSKKKYTFDSSFTWLWKSDWSTLEYSVKTLATVFANLFMYRFQISGSWHSNFWRTSKHWVNWVNTSTTEFEKFACSVFFWNYLMEELVTHLVFQCLLLFQIFFLFINIFLRCLSCL